MSLLRVNQLKKSYVSADGESTRVVDVDDFILKDSEFCGMRGESGSGKTTFLHLLAGILSPDSGEIELMGKNLRSLSHSERDGLRASVLGYVFQTFNLLQGFTSLENLKIAMSFAGSTDHEIAIDLLGRVGLSKRLHYYPHQLSIGQQQRVALARALVNKPKLVLADEPTGNLDPSNASKAIELLHELCLEANSALLVVSHDEGVIQGFDRQVDWGIINHPANTSEQKNLIRK
ncbi:MAG: ABC transporter ATP-binding protein [Opitutae bacterium]|jgi:ABC-type lipoprotein export system ATPase subunit|nr:ABC transporter ATP-binding protein [Opitutae bacterium]